MTQPDILIRLRKWASYDTMPNNWGEPLTADLSEAIAEIERLRVICGAVSSGPDLSTIRKAVLKRADDRYEDRQ